MTPSAKKLVLFDMDGVILDSAPAIVSSLEHALRENHVPVPDRAEIEAHVGPPLRVMLTSIIGNSPTELIDRCASAYRIHNDRYGPMETKVFEEARSSIPRLVGRVGLRVATSKAEHSARAVMHELDMARYFADVHGTLNPSSDTKADVMTRAIEAHGLRDVDVLAMVGDRAQDIEAAKSLGICSIAVTWGYAVGDELLSAQPDFLVDSSDSLLAVISDLIS